MGDVEGTREPVGSINPVLDVPGGARGGLEAP